MSVSKINPVYQVNSKQENDTLSATEWNNISSAVNAALTKINEILDEGVPSGGGSSTPSSDSHITMNNKGNLNIVTTSADQVNNKGAKINIEPYADLQVKPGDDITFYSHHREEGKREEVALKIMNGAELTVNGTKLSDYPVDLQVNAANVKFTTKDKETYITNENIRRSAAGKENTSDAKDILNMEIKTGVKSENASRSNPEYGYLKVRARAIDLRCEEHGGIALQPKGTDISGNINKIKFEHGGGDGLEFGTFNTEKTSIFTDEYRFNKDGVWKMATRKKVARDTNDSKYDANDATTHYTYTKQEDDFYDVIDQDDEVASTNAIIKTANAFNYGKNRHAKITSKGNIEIGTNASFVCYFRGNSEPQATYKKILSGTVDIVTDAEYSESDIKSDTFDGAIDFNETFGDDLHNLSSFYVCLVDNVDEPTQFDTYEFVRTSKAPKINIESGSDVKVKARDAVEINSDDLKLDVLNIDLQEDSTITTSENDICSLYDIVKLVSYMKTNNEGPWASLL